MRTNTSILILLGLQFIITLTMASVVSLAPALAAFFQVETSQVFLLNIGFMLSGVFSPIFGYFADKHGVKRMLVLGAFTFSLGTLLTAFATHPQWYIFTRMLIGIGHNVFFGLVAAYSAQLVDANMVVKLSGYYKIAFATGIFLAPVIAGFLVLNYSFQVFYLIMFGAAFAFTLAMTRLPKVSTKGLQTMTLNDFAELLQTPYIRWTLAMVFLIAVAPNSMFSFLSVHLNSLGYDQVYISFAYLILGLGSIISGFIILFLNKHFTFSRFLSYSIYGVLASLALFVLYIPAMLLVAGFFFAVAFDLLLGVLYPYLAQLPTLKSSSLISLASLIMAITAIGMTLLNPITFALGGYRLMALIALGAALLAYLSFTQVNKHLRA